MYTPNKALLPQVAFVPSILPKQHIETRTLFLSSFLPDIFFMEVRSITNTQSMGILSDTFPHLHDQYQYDLGQSVQQK